MRKYSMSRNIGSMGVFFIMASVIFSCGAAPAFFDIPSIMLVFGITFFLLLANFGLDFLMFIPDSLMSLVSTPEPNPKYAEIAKFGNRYAIGAGALGTVVGFINMLQNLDDPAQIGYGMAVSLLCFFYAIILAEFYFAYLYRTYLGDKGYDGNEPLSLKPAVVPIVFVLLLLSAFFILMCTLSVD